MNIEIPNQMPIYSPNQVLASTFIGGIPAAIFVLKKNYDVLGNKSGSRKTIIFGSMAMIFLFAFVAIPSRGSTTVIPVLYAVIAKMIAGKYQMSKEAISESYHLYRFQSNWKVIAIGVAFLIVTIAILIVWALILQKLGLMKPFTAPAPKGVNI